ncbi:MAG: hypothetical protein AAF907_14685 [Planctomycetota bacterium]
MSAPPRPARAGGYGPFESLMRHCTPCGKRIGNATSHCLSCWDSVHTGTAFCRRCGVGLPTGITLSETCPTCRLPLREGSRLDLRSPWFAAVLGFFLPGLGQIVLGRVKRGIAVLFVAVALTLVTLGLAWPLIAIGSAVDCFRLASARIDTDD